MAVAFEAGASRFVFSFHSFPNLPHESAEGALPDAGDDSELKDAAAFASADGTSQATGHDRQRAAAAQQLHALRVVAAPTLQRREFKRAL